MDQPKGDPNPSQVAQFQGKCSADGTESVCPEAKHLSISVGQRIRRQGAEEMWQAVAVHCREETDGTLVVRVIINNPDWEEALQIASLRSRPADPESLTPLGANLDHVAVRIGPDAENPGGDQSETEEE